MSRIPPKDTRALRVPEALWAEVGAAAARAGITTSEWVRQRLAESVSGAAGGVPTVVDPEYTQALTALGAVYGVREPAGIVRMAVLAAARRMRAGVDPFRIVEMEPAGQVTIPAPTPAKAPKPRK